MISYELYKVAHVVAAIVIFMSLAGTYFHAVNGGTRATNAARRVISTMHGLGLLVSVIAGFGLLTRLDLMRGGMPPWVFGKLAIWLIAGLLLTLPQRKPSLARPILVYGLPFLAAAAVWLAVYKPGN